MAYNYTPIVAGLLWASRVLMLEYALPKYGYENLNWPDRSHHADWGKRLEDIRKEHMVHESCSSISFVVSLLAYGKSVSIAEGATTEWSF